jgi:hypothetical protein
MKFLIWITEERELFCRPWGTIEDDINLEVKK